MKGSTVTLKVSIAQINTTVGNINSNTDKILHAISEAEAAGSDLLLTPELGITGYPPEDLLLRGGFVEANMTALMKIQEATVGLNVAVVVGFVDPTTGKSRDSQGRKLANAATVIRNGEILHTVHKTLLPTYGVFDEARYFTTGMENNNVFILNGVKIGLLVCEDLWTPELSQSLVRAGAEVLVTVNASPYHQGKTLERSALLSSTATTLGVPVVYAANVGGQDEIVFDGGSVGVNASGETIGLAKQFEEDFITFNITDPAVSVTPLGFLEETYLALMLGMNDYIKKSGFKSVLLGLSGGIDSALVATLAADALGGENVWGVTMPGPYSSGGSVSDAQLLADKIGCRFDTLSIKELYETELALLKGSDEAPGPFAGTVFNVAEENLQARLRMTFLMSISNKHGNMVLTTGNKSEAAVGYCTLYGDTAGGYAPIKDVYKTIVFDLCRWRNDLSEADLTRLNLRSVVAPIPEATITKPPSAELAPGQQDDQTLPPYPVLDNVLRQYVEEDASVQTIISSGVSADVVMKVTRLVDINEHKRRQVALGTKITRKAFGKDRRMPITNGWRN